MPAGTPRDRALVEAFVAYLRRQLADPHAVALLGRHHLRVPTPTSVVVTAGPPNRILRSALREAGLLPRFLGTARADASPAPGLPVGVWDRWDPAAVAAPPPSFTVTAVVTTYNEVDIVDQLLDRLLRDGLRVHVIDNWSTDGTHERVLARTGDGSVTLERWPLDGPDRYFNLFGLLGRVEEVAHGSGSDWVLHHDADQIHEAPWPGVSLREALWAIQGWGFNAIDHTGFDFRPVDDRWRPGADLETSFDCFELPPFASYFTLIKGWKPQAQPVDLSSSGGHEASFSGRHVFPYKFLIRHYPIRSQAQGERKILQERKQRFDPVEREKGWHTHYDQFVDGSSFLWDPVALHRWENRDERLLLQRLSGAGLPGNPRPEESIV